MILITAIAAAVLLAPIQAGDPAPTVRRIATTALLAAQEYRLGLEGGRVVSAAEVHEARLFLTEAIRAAGTLPDVGGEEAVRGLRQAVAMVDATAPAESLEVQVRGLVEALAGRFGVELDEVPAEPPSLGRGAAVYQATCARCHGALGRGDGPDGRGMAPAPGNLADAVGLADLSPLDFYRRTTIGVAGTAMPGFERTLSVEDRWAVALYASTLRLPAPAGAVPPALTAFATSGRMSDAELLAAMGPDADLSSVAAVRASHSARVANGGAVFAAVRRQLDSVEALARAGDREAARQMAFDAYLTFEGVEREVRVKDARLAGELEAAFAALRAEAEAGAEPAGLAATRRGLDAALERAERTIGDRLSPLNLFVQSFILLLREGLEAILVIGALIAFLMKTGAAARRRDIHVGVGAAVAASLLTAVALETVFLLSPANQELLEGITLAAAAVMLFYVSYWLLSKLEVARWNRFVKGRVQEALTSGSALALASVAFLAVYREGFETVLFYKALVVSAGAAGLLPVGLGMALGGVALGVVYVLVNRYGVRLPLKPFFGVTSAFLYYMAFVFAGKAVAELQGSGVLGTTVVGWAPRLPILGIYPTVESLLAQAVLVALALAAVVWMFVVAPSRARRSAAGVVAEVGAARGPDRDVLRSLDRIEADVAEIRAEVERLRARLGGEAVGAESRN